jgi:hypothetical protein
LVQDEGPGAEEIEYWKDMLSQLDLEGDGQMLPMVTAFLLLNLTAFLLTDQYPIFWILSSLWFCVFSVLFFIMPTTRAPKEHEPEDGKPRFDKASLLENKKLLGLALWNGFFMNTRPMAFGITAIFFFDTGLVVYLGIIDHMLTMEVTGILLLQSVGIILYYVGIVWIRPYDMRFLEEVRSIGRSVKGVWNGRSLRQFRSLFLTVLVLTVFVASTLIATLLPGSSIRILRGDSNIDLARGAIPLILVFLSQFILVRVTQGRSSRMMAKDLLMRKLGLIASPEPAHGADMEELDALMPMYFKVVRHDILGHLPVYLMSPDLKTILK